MNCEENQQKKIDISVIMCVYMHGKYLRQALTSIIEQKTDYNYEILVGEDCSPDNSRQIMKEFEKKYPEKFHMYYRDKNIGATLNTYELFMAAKGKYIATLEGDDYWIDEFKLQKQAEFLDSHPEYIGVASNFKKVSETGETLEENCICAEQLNCPFGWRDFLEKGFVFQSATLMYRNYYHDGGDYSIIYRAHRLVGDLTCLTIMLNRGDFYIMPDNLSAYRFVIKKDGTNAVSIANRDRALSSMRTVKQCDMLKSFLNNKRDLNPKISSLKADFLIGMVKHKEGYTWKRWEQMRQMGEKQTNLQAVLLLVKIGITRVFIKK